MNNGDKLKTLRNERDYSQQEVADKLKISKSKYCRLENNEAILNTDELQQILKIYNISYEEFAEIDFPVIHTISFPKKILDKLEHTINENKEIMDDWNLNRKRFNLLKESLKPVLEIRNEALNFPSFNLNEIPNGTTVKMIRLDMRGEILINECFNLQDKYCRVLFGGEN